MRAIASHSSAGITGAKSGSAAASNALVIGLAEAFAAGPGRVADVDDEGLALQPGERRLDDGGELGVGQQHFGLAVAEDKGDGFRVEPDVERIEHGTRHRHPEMRLECLGRVGRHHRHGVTMPDAPRRQRRGEPAAALKRFAPAVAALAIDDRVPVGKHRSAARQKAERGQRHKVRHVFVESDLVGVAFACGTHARSSLSAQFCRARRFCRAALHRPFPGPAGTRC